MIEISIIDGKNIFFDITDIDLILDQVLPDASAGDIALQENTLNLSVL